jgi:hypothetical protein
MPETGRQAEQTDGNALTTSHKEDHKKKKY